MLIKTPNQTYVIEVTGETYLVNELCKQVKPDDVYNLTITIKKYLFNINDAFKEVFKKVLLKTVLKYNVVFTIELHGVIEATEVFNILDKAELMSVMVILEDKE